MANEEQLAILRQGVEVWNEWWRKNLYVPIDLREADLRGMDLSGAIFNNADLQDASFEGVNLREADFSRATLSGANFSGANLYEAELSFAQMNATYFIKANLENANLWSANLFNAFLIEANLSKANLVEADLENADLRWADLSGANLSKADLNETDLSDANLLGANLAYATLVRSNVNHAIVSKSTIYGVNVWDLIGEFKEQNDLIITLRDNSSITVDNIEIAQFVYLILNNKKIRNVINTLTSKTVLILGRFAIPERKAILDALRSKLREHDLLPIVFDFDRPTDKDFTETIKTLAGISYFVIADVTNPKSSPLELQATVPDYQIPFVPIIQEGESPFALMVDLQKKYPWVLPTRSYDSIETLMSALKPGIIDPAVEMRNKLRLVKAQEQVTESLRDYVEKTL